MVLNRLLESDPSCSTMCFAPLHIADKGRMREDAYSRCVKVDCCHSGTRTVDGQIYGNHVKHVAKYLLLTSGFCAFCSAMPLRVAVQNESCGRRGS